jgi:hypothetical protein
MKLKVATRWEVKVEGDKRSIQLYDAEGNPLKGEEALWKGIFLCYHKGLTSLEGAPRVVGYGFYCYGNQLTSLKGAPEMVGHHFNCSSNELTSLEGGPKQVAGDFYCHNNKLTSLKGSPEVVLGDFYCHDNPLKSFRGSPKKLGGSIYSYNNNLNPLTLVLDLITEKLELFTFNVKNKFMKIPKENPRL